MEKPTTEDQHERAANEVARFLQATATMGPYPLAHINERLREIGYLLVITRRDETHAIELITVAEWDRRLGEQS